MLGEAVKIIRVFNGLNQQELADSLKISASYLSQIESGKRTPGMDTVHMISRQFHIPVSSLIFFAEQLESDGSDDDREKRLAFGRRILSGLAGIAKAAE